jgi:hypothetical protein
MDRIWQWAWDRHGAKYSWACFAVNFVVALMTTETAIVEKPAEQADDHGHTH